MKTSAVSPRNSTRTGQNSTDGRSRRWLAHREHRRNELLKQARHAIAQCGATASMSHIAEHCNTSKSVFYRYFTDKSGLRTQLGQYVVEHMRLQMEDAVAEAGSFEESVRALITQYVWNIRDSPEVYRFIVTGTQTEDDPVDKFCQAIAELVLAAHQHHTSPELHMPSVIAQCWAVGVVGFVRGAGETWMRTHIACQQQSSTPCPHVDLEHFVESTTTWVINGASGLKEREGGNHDAHRTRSS